ncbi:MAG: aspartate kinase [Cyclobacteriaceae bacterium]|nr:aspartate kinase [Cyclobacteriaceae bacterium]
MKVLKFGGTSVGKPSSMHMVAKIVTETPGPKIVVLSALSGTTNSLVKIGEDLTAGKHADASAEIESLYTHYLQFQDKLVQKDVSKAKAQYVINEHFTFMRSLLKVPFNDNFTKELLAQGELMSTKLFSIYLEEAGFRNAILPALEFMAIDENDEPNMDFIIDNLGTQLRKHPEEELFITQGYICLNADQKIDNLKRGGSDYTASLVGAACYAELVQIWTDIDGMHNNDPRVVSNTRPVAELSFDEASELAYFGAKILHPSSILPAKQYNIPVQLKNTMEPEAYGTMISSQEKNKTIKAIAAKDGITAIKIKSTRMLLAYGFLSRVFDVFEKFKTPIDMITTSEVAVSLTIDNDARLTEILDALEAFGSVTVDPNQSIICMVGNDVVREKGIVKKIFDSLEDIPIRMISYGGSKYNISVLTETQYKKKALIALNKGLFGL